MRVLGVLAAIVAGGAAFAAETVRTGPAAYGDWRTDAPGVRRLITPADLPPPFATLSAGNPSRRAARAPLEVPKAPEGFSVDLFAEGLSVPRVVRTAPNGDIFVAENEAGRVRVFRPDGASATPTQGAVFAEGLERPFGIAFYSIDRPALGLCRDAWLGRPLTPIGAATSRPRARPRSSLTCRAEARTRRATSPFRPTAGRLFVSVGSATNVDQGVRPDLTAQPIGASGGVEQDRADVLAFDPDGGHRRVVATGIRNCSGLTVQPATGALWCAVNERDGLGDDLPPDYATRVVDGAFYGWPWYYIGAHEDPRHKGERPELAGQVTTPDVLFQPHSAPLGITFYEGDAFPAEYKGDAFVAFHGSWNRAKRTGYKVVRLLMKDGKPTGRVRGFPGGLRRQRRKRLGPSGRRRSDEGRRAAGHRRRGRSNLASAVAGDRRDSSADSELMTTSEHAGPRSKEEPFA